MKGDLFVLSWVRVRRLRRGSISSELLMCGGGVRSILFFPLVASCLETMDVCIWHMFDFMSVVVTLGVGVPNNTAYKRWSWYSDYKLLYKLCRNLDRRVKSFTIRV